MTNSRQKIIRRIEILTLEVSNTLEDGAIEVKHGTKFQNKLNDYFNELTAEGELSSKDSFIVYELQALLHWIKGDIDEAYDYIKHAASLKDDTDLFTRQGKLLLENSGYKTPPKYRAYAYLSLIAGILGVIFSHTAFSLLLAGIAVSVGVEVNNRLQQKSKIAIAGVVMGVITVILFILILSALPTLREGQRNSSRISDLYTVTSLLKEFKEQNDGNAPSEEYVSNESTSELLNEHLIRDYEFIVENKIEVDKFTYYLNLNCKGISDIGIANIQTMLEGSDEVICEEI